MGVSRALDLVLFHEDDGDSRVSCQGHRSSSAVTQGLALGDYVVSTRGLAGSPRCPSMWRWRSTMAHFAHSPGNSVNW
jgi:hypothetical protein